HGQTQGINRKQNDAALHRALSRGQGKNGGEDGADAWRPTEGEGEADHEGAPHGFPAHHLMHSFIGIEGFDLKEAGEVKSEDNDHHSGDDGEDGVIALGDLSDLSGGGAERDEDYRESKDEGE